MGSSILWADSIAAGLLLGLEREFDSWERLSSAVELLIQNA
jgi:hypothetical protein